MNNNPQLTKEYLETIQLIGPEWIHEAKEELRRCWTKYGDKETIEVLGKLLAFIREKNS